MTQGDELRSGPGADAPGWRARLLAAWVVAVIPLAAICAASLQVSHRFDLGDLFFAAQDVPALIVSAAVLLLIRFAPAQALARFGFEPPKRLGPGAMATGVAAVAAAGVFVVFGAYPLSMDEFMAEFDAAIFRAGHLAATVPAEWRAFHFPLQPQFLLRGPGGESWVSLYLPVNALLRAGAGLAGAAWAVGPACAAFSVLMVHRIARRLWPERPDAALLAAALLASSAQLLVTAMTPYAMSAHLAFNLVWLWLFLRRDWASQVAAMGVAALACGLHQAVFHPLFAAPFVLGLWLSRQWARAGAHTLAYAVIMLFWLQYWRLVLPGGSLSGQAGADPGFGFLLALARSMLSHIGPDSVADMAKNLVRFLTWQNPLAVALAALGAVAAVRREPVLRAILAGLALTVLAMGLIMPFQGHGWGYRYLHGFLGGLCHAAAYGWMRLTDGLEPLQRRAAAGVGAICLLVALAGLAPLRMVQAHAFSHPYAVAMRTIERSDAEVVLVDPGGLLYAADLVRNDPFLRNRPKVMDLGEMTPAQVRAVCAQRDVQVFGSREAIAAGIQASSTPPTPRIVAARAELDALGCATQRVKGP